MTKFSGDKQQLLALGVFVKLMRAAESVSSVVHRDLADKELTVSQFGVLEALYHLGPLCQKDLAAKILKSTGNITMVIDNLEKRDLVKRQKDERDRRYFIVHLTQVGRGKIADIFPGHAAMITRKMSRLNEKDLKELGRLCRTLGQA